jgi:hypothetical protein
MWQPGQSGNPGGRTVAFQECQAMCREASPRASMRLIELMESADERVALMAADKVLERAWGKPKEQDDASDAARRLSNMTDAQRLAEAIDIIARAREALALSGPMIEGEGDEGRTRIGLPSAQ